MEHFQKEFIRYFKENKVEENVEYLTYLLELEAISEEGISMNDMTPDRLASFTQRKLNGIANEMGWNPLIVETVNDWDDWEHDCDDEYDPTCCPKCCIGDCWNEDDNESELSKDVKEWFDFEFPSFNPENIKIKKPVFYSFSEALEWLEEGYRITRNGWNGKGMWLELQKPTSTSKMTRPYIFIKTAQDDLVPWNASHGDILGKDWIVLDND